MKSADVLPPYPAQRFIGKRTSYLDEQLMIAGIRLDIFSHLRTWQDSHALAEKLGYDERNVELFCNALTAMGYLEKSKGAYRNFADTDLYLNAESDLYLGEFLTFWHDITDLSHLEDQVRHGGKRETFNDEGGSDAYDFVLMGRSARACAYTGSIQMFLKQVADLVPTDRKTNVLDIGGGSGVYTAELAKHYPLAQCTLIDQQQVIEQLTRSAIEEAGVGDRVRLIVGDFNKDDFGNEYDLVIMSGVLDFADDLDNLLGNLYPALSDGGYLYISTHKVNDDFTAPAQFIMGWLASSPDGLSILKSDSEIRGALERAGFVEDAGKAIEGFSGYLFRKAHG